MVDYVRFLLNSSRSFLDDRRSLKFHYIHSLEIFSGWHLMTFFSV